MATLRVSFPFRESSCLVAPSGFRTCQVYREKTTGRLRAGKVVKWRSNVGLAVAGRNLVDIISEGRHTQWGVVWQLWGRPNAELINSRTSDL